MSKPLDSNSLPPAAQNVIASVRRARKAATPYLPFLCRVLLVSTFIEDGVRILFEMHHQVDFLRHEYSIPGFIGTFMLLSNIIISFIAVAFILARKKIARGQYENYAAYALIGCVIYQQILYGRHSPIGSGNLGFFVRNLCLSGSLMLITCQTRIASGRSALPMGLLDGHTDKQTAVSYLQLTSRILLVLLALEFISTLGIVGTILTVPVVISVLVGFQLEISGGILLILYFLHNVLNSAFWSVSGSYISQIMQYEYVDSLLLSLSGPSASFKLLNIPLSVCVNALCLTPLQIASHDCSYLAAIFSVIYYL